jgi:hypothetical protein
VATGITSEANDKRQMLPMWSDSTQKPQTKNFVL